MSGREQTGLPLRFIAIIPKFMYNILMTSLRLTLCGLLLVLVPSTALAYVTPEEVLSEEDLSVRFFEPPPSRRSIPDQQEASRLEAQQRREQIQQELYNQQNGTADAGQAQQENEEVLHGAAPEAPAMPAVQQQSQSGLSEREQRILERISVRQENGGYVLQQAGNTVETLHGGAPLAETGPATVVATLAILVAGSITLRRMGQMQAMKRS